MARTMRDAPTRSRSDTAESMPRAGDHQSPLVGGMCSVLESNTERRVVAGAVGGIAALIGLLMAPTGWPDWASDDNGKVNFRAR
jgi:hypothetical protein